MKPSLSPTELCRRYLAAIPGMTEGEGRDHRVFATACKAIERFDLSDDEILDALVAWDAEVNSPPLGPRLVREKFLSAKRQTQYDPALANSRVPRLDRGQDPDLRIVVAGFEGDYGEPFLSAGWREVEWFKRGHLKGGMGNLGGTGNHQQGRERLWLSPHCLTPEQADPQPVQMGMFGDEEDWS